MTVQISNLTAQLEANAQEHARLTALLTAAQQAKLDPAAVFAGYVAAMPVFSVSELHLTLKQQGLYINRPALAKLVRDNGFVRYQPSIEQGKPIEMFRPAAMPIAEARAIFDKLKGVA